MPQTSRDSFDLLAGDNLLPHDLAIALKGMVGVHNIVIQNYTKLDIAIVQSVIEKHLPDIRRFTTLALRHGEH